MYGFIVFLNNRRKYQGYTYAHPSIHRTNNKMAHGIETKILLTFCLLVLPIFAENENFLDIEQPSFFQYNSPLQQPDSLRSQPYFDFLSTLYRHDNTKSDLFRPYIRQRRDLSAAEAPSNQIALDPLAATAAQLLTQPEKRSRRAILFRPLFVYKQQQVRRQEAIKRRKRV